MHERAAATSTVWLINDQQHRVRGWFLTKATSGTTSGC
jgi:hypothetical protein